jgi:hypothetical protein
MMLLQINKQRSILAVAAYLQNEQNRAAARNCNGEAQARIKFNAQRKINQAEQYVPVFYLHSRDAPSPWRGCRCCCTCVFLSNRVRSLPSLWWFYRCSIAGAQSQVHPLDSEDEQERRQRAKV